MRTKISIYLLLIFAGVSIAKAQDNEIPNDTIPIQAMSAGPGLDISLPSIIPPTPTSAVFQQRAAAPPNLSTGMVNINIPLYTLNVNGFQLPFFLNYQTSGIKPTATSLPLGFGWAFMPGLRISRTVMGRPDDNTEYRMDIRCASKLSISNSDEAFEYLRSLLTGTPGNRMDSQYDIFSLHLPTENVRFIMHRDIGAAWYDWTVITIGSGVRIRPILHNTGVFNGFEVTDEQGVIYLFGETACYSHHQTPDINRRSKYIEIAGPFIHTAWLLRKIILPGENNTIKFNWFRSIYGGTAHSPNSYTIRDDFRMLGGCGGYYLWEFYSIDTDTNASGGGFSYMRLVSVEFSSGRIEISYQNHTMQNMRVYSRDNNVKNIVFNVNRDSRLLDSVQIGANKYRFEYERCFSNDFRQSRNARDWWGFYNAANNLQCDVPRLSFELIAFGTDARPRHPVGQADRSVNRQAMQQNILRQITYPTGGFSRYYYEPHRFDYPARAAFREGGGLRVSRIVTQESATAPQIIKTFHYGENGFGTPTIEPIPSSFFRVRKVLKGHPMGIGYSCPFSNRAISVFANSTISKFTAFNPVVWYNMVTVRTSTGGKTIYRFAFTPDDRCTTLRDFSVIDGSCVLQDFLVRDGDGNLYQQMQDVICGFRNLFNQGPRLVHRKVYNEYRRILEEEIDYALIRANHFSPIVDMYGRLRGLLVEQRYIFSGSNDNGLFCDFCCTNAYWGAFREFRDRSIAFRNYYIHIETHRPSVVTRRHFNPDGTYLRERTYYHYVVHYGVINGVRYGVINLDRVTTTSSEGTNFTRRFLYPDSDLSMLTPAQKAAAERMRQRNLLTTPIAEIQTLNGSRTVRINQFKDWGNNLLLPERIYLRQGDNADVLRIQFLDYDRFGNPVSIIKDNSERAAYFWGYNGRYPIIEVIGKTRDEIRNSLAGVNIVLYNQMASGVIGDDAMIRSFGEMLRQNLNAFVSTFTYEPLIGVTSITDPRGITTFYEYDCFGRLITIYRMNNGAREILQTFEYHFAHHSIECPGIEEPEPPCRKQIWNGRLRIYGDGFDLHGNFEYNIVRSQQFNICHPVTVRMRLEVHDWHDSLCFYHVNIRNTTTNRYVFNSTFNNGEGTHGGEAIFFTIDDYRYPSFRANLSDIGSYEIILIRVADHPANSNSPNISYDIRLEFSLE